MRIVRALACFATMNLALVAIACGSKNEPEPVSANAAATAGYPQQPYPQQQYPQQYPQQQYPQDPNQPGVAPQPQPGAPVPGQMATPGPLAFPCQNDSGCGLARCNTQFGKCAFPCQSDVDCIQNAACNAMTGFCLPRQ